MPTNGTTNGASKRADNEVFIVSAVRTPIGSFLGSLSALKAVDLASIAIRKALDKISLAPEHVEKVTVGQAIQAGSGQAAAKQALIKAGLPPTCRDCLINEVCASGMQAVISSALQIKYLNAQCLVAAGMESMSNVPRYSSRQSAIFGPVSAEDGILIDGLTDTFNQCQMGKCAEHTAKKFSITRESQDSYAIESYRRAQVASESGLLAREICDVEIVGARNRTPVLVSEDEEFKKLKVDKVRTLKPCFSENAESGTITAANASSLSDGAAACVLMSAQALEKHGLEPLAKLISHGEGACDPIDFATSPAEAIQNALREAGLTKDDISLWEINEAFSVVPLAIIKELNLDHSKVNVNGGGVSIGHPLGMSGIRIVNALAHQLGKGQYGCAAICRGGGGSAAVIIKKL